MANNKNHPIPKNNSNLDDSNQVDVNDRYQMAMFKKRIMWKATIFAMKIVSPVLVLVAIIYLFFFNN